jgi:hypothetical protein
METNINKTNIDMTKWLQAWKDECTLAKKENRSPNPFFESMSSYDYENKQILVFEK